ncbi:hypothetical protein EMPS_08985 [Entomortierella parvispora]|uniref:Mid2 domain-containing protein n=1 Tax=Entomortierella parvispora TaxID=205924 RepID=A0A9P3HHB5_9FUNG|nr:hypothetical protein EMPS_08985 [Entomortierella parvispora]
MDTWPGTLVYQPTQAQAPCGCNQNYYDQVASCMSCQSSSSAHYSVKAQPDYELVCTSFNQPWTQINIPGQTTSSAATAATSTPKTTHSTSPSPGGMTGEKSSQSSNLSSGALAGIIVSAIALVVALSVAAYVITRRRRDSRKQKYDTQYKYNDPHNRDSYAESGLPQYTGITSVQPMSNLRVMNPDSDDEGNETSRTPGHKPEPSFEVSRTASPGWRRGSFDDD